MKTLWDADKHQNLEHASPSDFGVWEQPNIEFETFAFDSLSEEICSCSALICSLCHSLGTRTSYIHTTTITTRHATHRKRITRYDGTKFDIISRWSLSISRHATVALLHSVCELKVERDNSQALICGEKMMVVMVMMMILVVGLHWFPLGGARKNLPKHVLLNRGRIVFPIHFLSLLRLSLPLVRC